MTLTFFLVVMGWIIFRADTLAQAGEYIAGIASASLFSKPDVAGITGFSLAIVIMVLAEWFQRGKEHALDLDRVKAPVLRYIVYAAVIFLAITLGGHSENFIYVQF